MGGELCHTHQTCIWASRGWVHRLVKSDLRSRSHLHSWPRARMNCTYTSLLTWWCSIGMRVALNSRPWGIESRSYRFVNVKIIMLVIPSVLAVSLSLLIICVVRFNSSSGTYDFWHDWCMTTMMIDFRVLCNDFFSLLYDLWCLSAINSFGLTGSYFWEL